jgi:hypothetical protein
MMSSQRAGLALVLVLATIVTVLAALPAAAEEEKKLGWLNTAEFSYVLVSGNAESTTWGLADKNVRTWENAVLTFKAGGLRAESTAFTRYAEEIDPGVYLVHETKTTQLTGEAYLLNGQYDRKISGKLFWNAFAGWDRNRFAGIDNRYQAGGGLTNIWRDDDHIKFRTDYSVTYTDREDVVVDPDDPRDDKFAGIRFAWDYQHKFGAVTTYVNTLVLDDNVSDTSDWRGDMVNSVSVAMTKKLALKASLRWVYYNKPALESIPVVDTDPPVSVLVELRNLDTYFTTSLVMNW